MATILANKAKHIGHAKRCVGGLGTSGTQYDSSRMLIGLYCFAIIDLLCLDIPADPSIMGLVEDWTDWLWAQHIKTVNGSGFRPSPYMHMHGRDSNLSDVVHDRPPADSPHLIMTYSALLSLAILRDDFTKLDIGGLKTFLSAVQREDGSFGAVAGSYQGETDIRMAYCAFAICAMIDDWSPIDVHKAVEWIKRCRGYEGGYGQAPHNESHGGSTFCALAALYLASSLPNIQSRLSEEEKSSTVRWLVGNQTVEGGFKGRTEKEPDACYSFWYTASLKILESESLVDARANLTWIEECQFRFGGIAKVPDEMPDPYHTYLGLASLSLCRPDGEEEWGFPEMDPLLNARLETAQWIRDHLGKR
jgi:geranylgeranyl transferase type-1 subunit beta